MLFHFNINKLQWPDIQSVFQALDDCYVHW